MSAVDAVYHDEAGESAKGFIDYPRLWLISAAHLTNDMYGNLFSSLMPYLVIAGTISTTLAGLILLVYLIGSSVLQPFFGLVADRSGSRIFAVGGPLIVGVGACLLGWAPNVGALFALAAFAGLGTSAFHPQAASMVDSSSPRAKGRSMAIFSMGGNLGFAIGPLMAAAIATAGLHWSPVVVIPGVILTVLLTRFAPTMKRHATALRGEDLRRALRRSWFPMSLIVAVIGLRSATQIGMIIFLPLFYHLRGFAPQLGSYYAFTLSLSGAFGGIVGGHLSDVYGRKPVVVLSMALATPLLFLALGAPTWAVWPLLALAGAMLLANNSVTVVQGQELLPENTGVAAGFTMGIGFGLSGLLTTGLTTLSDHIGIASAIYLVPWLTLLGAGLALFLPKRTANPAA